MSFSLKHTIMSGNRGLFRFPTSFSAKYDFSCHLLRTKWIFRRYEFLTYFSDFLFLSFFFYSLKQTHKSGFRYTITYLEIELKPLSIWNNFITQKNLWTSNMKNGVFEQLLKWFSKTRKPLNSQFSGTSWSCSKVYHWWCLRF